MQLVLRVDEREGVRAEAVHVAVAVGDAAVGEEDGDLVEGLGGERPEVPHHGRGLEVGAGLALLGVDEVGELDGVADEEDRRVVADHVPVPFLGVELEREAAGVAGGVGRTLFAANGGEAGEHLAGVADLREELGLGVLRDVVGDEEVAVGAGALGVDDALGDALAVELGHLLEVMKVVEGDGAAAAGGDGVLVVADRDGPGWW